MLTAPLNAWFERARADSPRAQQLCAELAGKSLAIEVIGAPFALLLRAQPGALTAELVAPAAADAATLSLRGGVIGLLTALRADVQQLVDRGQLGFRGDHALAAPFQELLQLLRPDLEAQLTRAFGPVRGHYATRGLAGLASWGRSAIGNFLRTGGDFLAHESRDLVPRAEAEVYLEGVTELRNRVAAAEQRVANLEAQLAATAGEPAARPGPGRKGRASPP
jgi:ubiquinone biosynthesis protein UbiJ